jgi:hypothetical protein
MSRLRHRLLVTWIVFAALVVTTGGTAMAVPPGLSTISEHGDPPADPIGRFAGEPDVGQTSPASGSRVDQPTSLRSGFSFDEVLRLSRWLWKARHGLTGF